MTRRRKKSKRILLRIAILPALLLAIYVFWPFTQEVPENVPAMQQTEHSADPTGEPSSAQPLVMHPDGFPDFTATANVADLVDTQYLKLVNRDRAVAIPVNDALLVTIWPTIPARTTDVLLHTSAKTAVANLLAAAGQSNIHDLFVASGFRSQAEQVQLYENAIDRAYVMTPGHSEHQLGLAADILSTTHDFAGMAGTPEAAWLAENAPRFGLTLRYPYDKQQITQVAYEPWHFRFVGRVHAWFMAEHSLVLEEYIAYLAEHGGYQTALDGKMFYVLYQRPQNGMIFVPEHLQFSVSSANTGGYIVTAWR